MLGSEEAGKIATKMKFPRSLYISRALFCSVRIILISIGILVILTSSLNSRMVIFFSLTFLWPKFSLLIYWPTEAGNNRTEGHNFLEVQDPQYRRNHTIPLLYSYSLDYQRGLHAYRMLLAEQSALYQLANLTNTSHKTQEIQRSEVVGHFSCCS